MKKHRLLIVEDDDAIRTQLKWALAQDYEVYIAGDRQSALDVFRVRQPSVTMLDLGLPPSPSDATEGMAVLSDLLSIDRNARVLIVSGQGEKENALRAVGNGAEDFLCKPVDLDQLKLLLQRHFYVSDLEIESRELCHENREERFEGMVGKGADMEMVFSCIRKVAPTNAPVLILGESGTGKEMAALAIHRKSPRSDKPFVAINCSAIPGTLLESELFGYEKGAFTGAVQQRKGLLESAAGGTLFLDEIGDMPTQVQVKLLRFLQEQTFMRVGGRQELKTDARIIAATNADLKSAIAKGTFREDLYFRLAVVVVHLPALRDRGEDIGILAGGFLNRFAIENGKKGMTFAPETIRALNLYRWPGNVRELQNRVQRAVIMADGKRISVEDLELHSAIEMGGPATLKEARETVERGLVQQALKRHLGRISSAAAELGVSRPTLYELMEKLGISKEEANA